MSTNPHERSLAHPSWDHTPYLRVAAADRADAIRSIGRSIRSWLWAGVALRHTDDALTHPAAGKTCGC